MYCIKCGAQISETEAVCRQCGHKIKGKRLAWKDILLIVLSAVLALVVTGAILYATGVLDFKEKPNNAQYKDSYTVSAKKAQKYANKVIAKVNGLELTNEKLQMYYAMEVVDFVTEYYYQLSQYGLNINQPLDEQYYDEKAGVTWQQKFLDGALNTWYTYALLNNQSTKEAYELSQQIQESISTLPEKLQKLAEENGFTSAAVMIRTDYGETCTEQAYLSCMIDYYKAVDFFDSKYIAFTPDLPEIEEYFNKYESSLKLQGITKDSGNCVDVRHILIMPESTLDENGTTVITEQAWEACREKAQQLLDSWIAGGATEEAFAALAGEHSQDPGSVNKGGLYRYVRSGQMVEEFDDWLFEEGREKGNYGLVKTVHGYHLMYYVGDEPAWIVDTRDLIASTRMDNFINSLKMEIPLTVTYKDIVLGKVNIDLS